MYLKESKNKIETIFRQRVKKFPALFAAPAERMQQEKPDIQLALKYLYGAMPLSDAENYAFEVFLDYALQGAELWEICEKRQVPEGLYLNFVLNHRVNTEELTPCRSFFSEQLRDRVAGKSMKDTVLEVNDWCAGEAAYQTTDDRTAAPMTVYRCGYGRCGEESVFTVSALRSAGIPARQVYAPRWAHCDDNHAWAEAWCDGEWYFLGACEPEQILNRGWFTNASSRAMLIHSRCFGKLGTGEAPMAFRGITAEYNQLSRYAHTRKVKVKVQNETGEPAENVQVDFEILNYSEMVPAASLLTDSRGEVSLELGLGTIHLFAARKGECDLGYAQGFLDVRSQKSIVLKLGTGEQESSCSAFDIFAPEDAPVNTDRPDERQKLEGERRLREAREHREAKAGKRQQRKFKAFLAKDDEYTDLRNSLVAVLTVKDKNDEKTEVWEEHVRYAFPYAGQYPKEVFVSWVLNPRIEFELLEAYREAAARELMGKEELLRESPKEIWNLIQEQAEEYPQEEYDALTASPAACLSGKVGSHRAKKLLFVAMARTLGIPARLNPIDGVMEYWRDGKFRNVLPQREKSVRFVFKCADGTDWVYFTNWSVAKLTPSGFLSLDLSRLSWENGELLFSGEPGVYRVLTSNRLPNGNIFASQETIKAQKGQTLQIDLKLREADLNDMLENISLQDFKLKDSQSAPISLKQLTEKGTNILLWLEEGKEPTEHILNEMLEEKEKFIPYQEQITFILNSQEAQKDPTLSKTRDAFPKAKLCYDNFAAHAEPLARRMYTDPEKLPLILVCSRPLNAIYATSGYNVGTAALLLRLLHLQE